MSGKKGMKLRAWGTLRRLPSKNYQASYLGPDMARYAAPITYTARMDAEAWLASERRLIELDEWTSPKSRAAQRQAQSISLNDYADRWIEQRPLKQRTRLEYTRIKANLIAENIGKAPLRTITPDVVRSWYSKLGTKAPTRNKHAYGLLHGILATAVSDGLISSNPCKIVGAMNVVRKREPILLTPDELAQVADAIQPEKLRCLLLISAWCGLRWGEVIELRRKDIDDTCEVITVSRAVTHDAGCSIDTTKSGRVHSVVIPPHIRSDLKHHLEVSVEHSPDALVFPASRDGCHLNDSVFAKHLRPVLPAGKKGLRIHDLRHFTGTMTSQVGNVRDTMSRLGHSTPKASMIYQAQVDGRDAEIAVALSELATKGATAPSG